MRRKGKEVENEVGGRKGMRSRQNQQLKKGFFIRGEDTHTHSHSGHTESQPLPEGWKILVFQGSPSSNLGWVNLKKDRMAA